MRIAAIDQGTTSTRVLVAAEDGLLDIRHAVRHAQHPVMGAHARMRAAALRRNAQQSGDIFGTAGEVRGGDDEVVDGEFHEGMVTNLWNSMPED